MSYSFEHRRWDCGIRCWFRLVFRMYILINQYILYCMRILTRHSRINYMDKCIL